LREAFLLEDEELLSGEELFQVEDREERPASFRSSSSKKTSSRMMVSQK
jgi:hypothetical protein